MVDGCFSFWLENGLMERMGWEKMTSRDPLANRCVASPAEAWPSQILSSIVLSTSTIGFDDES